MKPSSLLFLIVISTACLAVRGSTIPSTPLEDDNDTQDYEEPTYEPRFVAVFLQTDDEDDDVTNSTTHHNTTMTGGTEQVYKKVRNETVNRVDYLLNNLNITDKVAQMIKRLGGDGTEEGDRFKNIIKRLENSTLGTTALNTVRRILNNMQNGEGFAILGA